MELAQIHWMVYLQTSSVLSAGHGRSWVCSVPREAGCVTESVMGKKHRTEASILALPHTIWMTLGK